MIYAGIPDTKFIDVLVMLPNKARFKQLLIQFVSNIAGYTHEVIYMKKAIAHSPHKCNEHARPLHKMRYMYHSTIIACWMQQKYNFAPLINPP